MASGAKNEAIKHKFDVSLFVSFPYKKRIHFIEKSPDRSDQLHLMGYQEFHQYLTLVMINNMAKEHCEFEIAVSVKAKSEIWQYCEFVKVKEKVSKTKTACRHCEIELKYSGNISNFSNHLTRKHSAVSLLFLCVCNQHFLFFPQSVLAPLTLSQTSPGFYVSAVQAF